MMSLVLMHLSIVTPNMGSTYKVTPVVGLLTQAIALGNTLTDRVGLLAISSCRGSCITDSISF